MTTSDTRRERKLRWTTADLQRYRGEKAADWLDAIKRQVCPFCGSGPFTVVAIHVTKAHGVPHLELRDILGVGTHESICDETHSAARREQMLAKVAAGAFRDIPRRLPGSTQRSTTAGRRANQVNGERIAALRRVPDGTPVIARKGYRSTVGPGPWCGTKVGYTNHACRCDACRAAGTAAARIAREKRGQRGRDAAAEWQRQWRSTEEGREYARRYREEHKAEHAAGERRRRAARKAN